MEAIAHLQGGREDKLNYYFVDIKSVIKSDN
jgi:hypothetical protein